MTQKNIKTDFYYLIDPKNNKVISIVLLHKKNIKLKVFYGINLLNKFLPIKQYSLDSLGKKVGVRHVVNFLESEISYLYHPEEFYDLVHHCKFHRNNTTKVRFYQLMKLLKLPTGLLKRGWVSNFLSQKFN